MKEEEGKAKPNKASGVLGKVLSVDQEICIACGACEEDAPKYFKLKGDEGKSQVLKKNVDESDLELIESIIVECPTEAISFE